MKIVYAVNKSLLECFKDALNQINQCKISGSKPVMSLNKSAYRNRVVDRCLIIYLQANYKKHDVIECEYRAEHHGVKIGSTLKHNISITDISVRKQAEILKRARSISQSIAQCKYL